MKDWQKAFDEFWELYPHGRRTSKAKCRIKYKKLFEVGRHPEIIKALTLQIKAHEAQVKANWKFIPDWKLAMTWLNGGCWEDDVEMPKVIKSKVPYFKSEREKTPHELETERAQRGIEAEKAWAHMAKLAKMSVEDFKKKGGLK